MGPLAHIIFLLNSYFPALFRSNAAGPSNDSDSDISFHAPPIYSSALAHDISSASPFQHFAWMPLQLDTVSHTQYSDHALSLHAPGTSYCTTETNGTLPFLRISSGKITPDQIITRWVGAEPKTCAMHRITPIAVAARREHLIFRVGHSCVYIYTLYYIVYLVISLSKLPHVHRIYMCIYMALANSTNLIGSLTYKHGSGQL